MSEAPQHDPLLGRELEGRYRLEARLGEGGLGVVYRARHLRLGRPFAIKVLQPAYAENEALRARFEREAKALGALNHPGVVGVTDFGIDGRIPFLVMELLTGATLDHRMPLPPDRALGVLRDVLSAVAYAHGLGLVHRDLKPANIFLEQLPEGAERVRVLDFGLAKFLDGPSEGSVLTRPGATLGTPAYMPPEQALGSATSPRSDVYSLGILLYELLSHERPFTGEGGELMRQHLLVPIPSLRGRPGLTAMPVDALDAIVAKAAGKTSAERYADAAEMRTALDQVLGRTSGAYAAAVSRSSPGQRVISRAILESSPTVASEQPASKPVPVEPAPTLAPQRRAQAAADTRRDEPPEPVRAPEPARRSAPPPRQGSGALAVVLVLVLLVGTALALAFVPRLVGLDVDPIGMLSSAASTAASTGASLIPLAEDAPLIELDAPVAAAPDAPVSRPDAPTRMARFDHDPWLDPAPPQVTRLRDRFREGRPLSDRDRDTLRDIGRRDAGDPRPWLLMAHHFAAEGAASDALERYERAVAVNDGARHDPEVLAALLRMSGHPTEGARAVRLLERWYGSDALPGLRALRVTTESTEDIERLDRLEEQLVSAPARLASPLPEGP